MTQSDLQIHECILWKANRSCLLKAWCEQRAQCQMLPPLCFRRLADRTLEAGVVDTPTSVLPCSRETSTGWLHSEIGRRVSRELIAIPDGKEISLRGNVR